MYYQEEGDIIFYKEGHWRDKIARYIMSSKSIWDYVMGKREVVPYYHVSIAYGNEVIFEQKRSGPRVINWNPNKKQIIFRHVNSEIVSIINSQKYDFLNCFGHLLAWLTGIQLFRYLHSKHRQNCVLMSMVFCQNACKEVFPIKKLWLWHTQDLYKYLLNNPNYEMVYKNE